MTVAEKIRTLVLSGRNNHDWRSSTPFVWLLLQRSGRFEVTVAVDPSTDLAREGALDGIDLIFMDYNGPAWSDAAKGAFEEAVRGGKGLLVLHAADNAFPGWVEFERMAALLWREGTGHGRFHEFPVTYVDREHPVTKGLADFRTTDELYHRLVHMHGAEYRLLATAFSSEESGGTGRDEPMMLTTQYGGGRVFHMVLGHVWEGGGMEALENEGFGRALLRACEWAATGEVTLE
jgi:type 1 glutamine amidotransferase